MLVLGVAGSALAGRDGALPDFFDDGAFSEGVEIFLAGGSSPAAAAFSIFRLRVSGAVLETLRAWSRRQGTRPGSETGGGAANNERI